MRDSDPETSGAVEYVGRACLYVLALAGPEDILKVGFAADPLSRWAAFHPRWFDAFDLDASLLVDAESRRDARRLETRLHRLLAAHACPVPMTMRPRAGGASEWFRGAMVKARNFVHGLAADGFVVHDPARPLIADAMVNARPSVMELVQAALRAQQDGALGGAQLAAVHHWLDAHRRFGMRLEDVTTEQERMELGLQ